MNDTTTTPLTKSRQITLPSRAQRALGMQPGDKVNVSIQGNQVILSAPRFPTVASLVGIAGRLDKPLSFDQMREIAYRDRFADKYQEADD